MRSPLRWMAACTLAVVAPLAGAAAYPDKPIKILVGYAAGGSTDVVARLVGERLAVRLKQPVVIDNVAGANGEIATRQLISRPADGYTLMWAASGQVVYSPAIQQRPHIDMAKEITPIAISSGFPYLVTVPESLPVKDLKGFVEYAKKHPKSMSFGSAGAGTANHLAGEWFNIVAGLDLRHVPYKGDAATAVDVASGNLQLGFTTPNVGIPLVKAGKLRVLAVTGANRAPFLPDVPTVVEQGNPGFVVEMFNGLVGKAGTPPDIVASLNKEINEIMKEPDVQAKLANVGHYPITRTPEGFRSLIQEQTKHWRGVVQKAQIPLQE